MFFHIITQLKAESLAVQIGDKVRFHLFADQLGVIKYVRGFLLQIVHTPSLDTEDQKTLYKAKEVPDDVAVRYQTERINMSPDFVMPFSVKAETEASNRANNSGPSEQGTLQEPCVNGDDQTSVQSEEAHYHVSSMPWKERKAGCVVTLKVPEKLVPHINMDQVRVNYYIRVGNQILCFLCSYHHNLAIKEARIFPTVVIDKL